MTYPADSVALAPVEGPIVRCETCGNELLGSGTIEHHDDGSHTYTPSDAEDSDR